MSTGLIAAAETLAELLVRENAALASLDLTAAAGMLADKQRATEALVAAQGNGAGAGERAAVERLAQRLRGLADENRRLLERAITVQGRVVGVIARAAPRAVAAPGYGAPAARASAGRPAAYALAANA